jgi:hypothetical protein
MMTCAGWWIGRPFCTNGWTNAGSLPPNPFDEAVVARRLERWCQLTSGGDWDRFARRLAWDGLDVARARLLAGTGRYVPDTPLPDWADFPGESTRILARTCRDYPAFCGRSPGSVGAARRSKLAWLAPSAHHALIDYLAERLRSLADPTQIDASGQGLAAHCLRYPVLARQLAQRSLDWAAEVDDFLARLGEDWLRWPGTSRCRRPPRRGSSAGYTLAFPIHTGAGAPSGASICPAAVWPTSPKNLQMDQALGRVGDVDGAAGAELQPRPSVDHPRQEHGWMEWAHPEPWIDSARLAQSVGDDAGAAASAPRRRLPRRESRAARESPLLLDGEMLVYPYIAGHAADDPLDVMRTGLLPRWLADQSEIAGVRGLLGEISTAHMIEGYHSACRFLADAWPQLGGETGLLSRLRQGRVRVAPRPTAAYLRLLDHLRHPAFLGDGIDFSIETDRLAYAYLTRPNQESLWPLLASEHRSLAQGDVPLFYGEIDHPDLFQDGGNTNCALRIVNCEEIDHPDLLHDGGTVADALRWPPFTLPSATVQAEQAGLIHASLDRSPYTPRADVSFLDAARHLGDRLAHRAIERGSSGSGGSTAEIRSNPLDPRSISPLTWIATQFRAGAGLWQHGLVGEDLYAGRAGIALFLAALARISGENHWRDLALAGLAGNDSAEDGGGRIYALSLAADLLAEPMLVERAASLARRLSSKRDSWGVLDGEAGRVLALLRLHGQLAAPWLLAQAVARGRAIVDAAAAWTHAQQGLGGFSHGTAGSPMRWFSCTKPAGTITFWPGQNEPGHFSKASTPSRRGTGRTGGGRHRSFCATGATAPQGSGWLGPPAPPICPSCARSSSGPQRCCLRRGAPLWTPSAVGTSARSKASWRWVYSGIDAIGSRPPARRPGGCWSTRRRWGAFQLYDDLPPHLFNPGFFRGLAGIGYTLLRLAAANGEVAGELACVVRSAWTSRDVGCFIGM